MNAPLTNLMTPPKAAAKPSGRNAPKAKRAEGPADRGATRPENVAGRAAGRAAGRKTERREDPKLKRPGDHVALGEKSIDIEQKTQSAPTGAAAIFATILQAAGQTDRTTVLDATDAKTVETVVPRDSQASRLIGPKGAAAIAEPVAGDSTAMPSKLADMIHSATTVPADRNALLKASAAAISAHSATDKNATLAKAAKPPVATGAAEAAPVKTAMDPQAAAAAAAVPAAGGEALKQFAPGRMKPVDTAVNIADRLAGSNAAVSTDNKLNIRNTSAQQAAISAPGANGVSLNRFAVLSQELSQRGQAEVKTPAPTAVNRIAAQAASPMLETATVQAAGAPTVQAASPVKQISEALEASAARDGQEIVIRLDPPHLGKVCVKLRMDGNEVRGTLDVENPRTLNQLQREAPNIIERLADVGIEMKRMDVSLSQDGGRDSSWSSQQFGQDAAGQGQWSPPGRNSLNDNASLGQSDSEETPGQTLMTVGGDSINVWI
jgi:flagellar hook-length control protein FliK